MAVMGVDSNCNYDIDRAVLARLCFGAARSGPQGTRCCRPLWSCSRRGSRARSRQAKQMQGTRSRKRGSNREKIESAVEVAASSGAGGAREPKRKNLGCCRTRNEAAEGLPDGYEQRQ